MFNPAKVLRSVAGGLFAPMCLILVMQAVASRRLAIQEQGIPIPGFRQLPLEFGKWRAPGEQTLDRLAAESLKPDEYILRDYVDPASNTSIGLFVAFFKSLQNTYGPHSPRVCLPATGWLIRSSGIKSLTVPGHAEGIPVNEYVLEKADNRILAVYWYQNNRNIWADEFAGKLRLLPDLIKYRRSDVSLVRLIVPMRGEVPEAELANCRDFMQSMFPQLAQRFGNAP